jgi:hypothetical protein
VDSLAFVDFFATYIDPGYHPFLCPEIRRS